MNARGKAVSNFSPGAKMENAGSIPLAYDYGGTKKEKSKKKRGRVDSWSSTKSDAKD